ncbi:DNA damage-regulated autophagy modulator protein 2-like isoform X2 [Tachypleus tridentatus]|uniref:DNA damage-regulated autophagy modulator protein 2-like isoform X2 n=1 Tax=Tachypleus tridentatus TaxID=6853 RepID=UPI003FCFDCC5
MALAKLYFLPLAVFVLLPGTFIITYVISILHRDVEVDFPYISDTGTYVPESCIFGQLLNIVACLIGATVYVRYKHVEHYCQNHLAIESTRVLRLNLVGLFLGLAAAFGTSLVANFQETAVIIVHMIGATMAFGLGMIYAWLQTVMSFYMYPLMNTKTMAGIRLFLSIVNTVCFIILNVATPISLKYFHGKDKTKWYPKDGGFAAHVVSTASEWILTLAFDFYFLTFVRELHDISMTSPKVIFLTEEMGISSSGDIYRCDDNLEVASPQSSGIVEPAYSREVISSVCSTTSQVIFQ